MLPFENRLTLRKDFERVSKTGSFFSLGRIGLKVGRNDLAKTRIGISIGLKFSKKAVARNRIKRQIGEIVRKKLGPIKKGFDVIVTVKKNGEEEIDSRELERMVRGAFKNGKLID